MTVEIQDEDIERSMTRRGDDMESIEWGSPSKGGKAKAYFNIRVDSDEDIKRLIDRLKGLTAYATSESLNI